jgi:ubiquinone/menaquinone biosynthesis C-methylase UbiE
MIANFDVAASTYDQSFTHTNIGMLQRRAVYQVFLKHLYQIKKVIEINCGTGEDAIWLAKQNIDVTATDISTKMIEVANTKSHLKNVNFIQADINFISEKFHNQTFDLLFSNFGGLNCLTKIELEKFLINSATILSNKGKLVLVIMPKHTLWEKMYFFLTRNFKAINRRTQDKIIANVDGKEVPTYYYNPSEIAFLAKSKFNLIEAKPIGFFVPPSYLESFFKRRKKTLHWLNKFELVIKDWRFLAKYADHYIIVLQKT